MISSFERDDPAPSDAKTPSAHFFGLSPVRFFLSIGGPALLLLALIPVPSFTTHDVERYLWDGRMVLEGLDPFRIRPSDSAVADLQGQWPVAPEHRDYSTLYPPAALGLFALASSAGSQAAGWWVWKALVAICGVLLLLLAVAWLRGEKAERHIGWLAWHPLLLIEAGIGAHLDVMSTLALVGGLWAWKQRKLSWAGAALGVGGLVKLLPAVIVVPLAAQLLGARDERSLNAVARLVAPATAVFLGGYGIAVLLGWVPWGSSGIFAQTWRFGSPVFALLEYWTKAAALPVAVAVVGVGCLAIVIWTVRNPPPQPWLPVAAILALVLLFSPVVFPWYLLPLIPMAVALRSATLMLWTLLHPLTYEVLFDFEARGVWEPATWPLVAIVCGWVVGAFIDARRWWAGKRLDDSTMSV